MVTKSASTLRKELELTQPESEINDNNEEDLPPHLERMDVELPNVTEREVPIVSKPAPPKKPKFRDLEKTIRSKNERRQRKENQEKLDPMDPAAYSDVPR